MVSNQSATTSKPKLSQKQKKLAKRRLAKERERQIIAEGGTVERKTKSKTKSPQPTPQMTPSLPPLPPAPPSSTLDSCETPLYAYTYLSPYLNSLPANTTIYDPYYCAGLVSQNLKKLRSDFKILNPNVDFYASIAQKRTPSFDLLITTPPYSGDHIEKCLSFCTSSGKPFACLLPSYVYNKGYYADDKMFMIIPKRRVRYVKSHVAVAKADVTGRDDRDWTAPFHSFWFCSNDVLPLFTTGEGMKFCEDEDLIVARNIEEIPNDFRDITDVKKKRKNPKQRKRDKLKKK